MTTFLPRPCARWAISLAAHPDDLSVEERRALDAHVASCPVCTAVRADYLRVNARIRSLPDPRTRPDLPPWLLALQAATKRDAPASNQIIPFHSTENDMQTRKEPGMDMPAPTPIHQGHQPRRRLVSWVTAVAALVVIAVITTALLVSHTGKPGGTGRPENTATSTPSGSQGWQTVPGLSDLVVQPVIAPSNSKVLYVVDSHPTVLRRSVDDGAHWQNLPLPSIASQVENPYLMINAANAENIFLLLGIAEPPSACSSSQVPSGQVNGYSGYTCQFPYYSTDGGAHWGLMRCLSCGKTNTLASPPGNLAPVGTIITQGNHLYSLYFDQNGNRRLIVSADGGATWQPADTRLLAQSQGVCSFAAVPSGSSAYALVQTGGCTQAVGYLSSGATHPQDSTGLAIWRTNDAGAHWMQVSAFPYQQPDTSNFIAVGTGGAQPTLFAAAGMGGTYTRLISTDGGKTWQTFPTQGIPAGTTPLFYAAGALSDGSILLPVQAGSVSQAGGDSVSFYALKPGSQVWQQVTPSFTASAVDPLVLSSAGGHDTIWVIAVDNKGDYSVLYYTLK